MIGNILESLMFFIINTIKALSYFGVFILTMAESACIPIPSEVIMPFSGFLVASGYFNFILVVLVATLGELTGGTITYYIGKTGGRSLVFRYGKYILISHHDLNTADRWFSRYGDKVVFFGRLLPIIRTYISFPAGVSKMKYSRFAFFTILGTLPWVIALTYLGVKLGANWEIIRVYFHKFDILILALILVTLVWYVWRHIKNIRKDNV